ncbi:MAG: metallophosphoesterase [Lachnospiraceae bacterium]|nr:metallophosphoesterase [Lachnospiraceae bacterium]
MKRFKKIILLLLGMIFILILILGFNTSLEVTNYTYKNTKIPDSFHGYKIAFISDLHHENFGENQSTLLEAIISQSPDIVVMTGDIVDEDHTDMKPVEDLLKGLSQKYPIYYVSGNHDICAAAAKQYQALQSLFETYGVIDLDDKQVSLEKNEETIRMTGSMWRSIYVEDYLELADPSYFNILLYHGSDIFDYVAPFGYDLVLSGHTHGGIIRLPFIGGLITNTRDFMPSYAGGAYKQGISTLISSRGLGDAIIPRFNNRPELVIVTLVNH